MLHPQERKNNINKLFLLITIIVGLLTVSCSHDEPTFGSSDHIHTTWSGTDVSYEDGDKIESVSFIVTFLTESEGKYIFVDENGSPTGDGHFTYNIDGNMITFNGAIVGNWTIIERTKDTIILRAFLPKEHKMYLNRITEETHY